MSRGRAWTRISVASLGLGVVAGLAVAATQGAKSQDAKAQDAKAQSGQKDEDEPLEIADDVQDVPARDLRALGDEKKRYFLIGPKKNEKPPNAGFALMVVMPGGDGVASFTSFVRRIWKECAPDDWLFAQLVSVKWKPDQNTIWPTRHSRVPGMQFTTEEYLVAVVEDVQKKQKLKIDPARIYQLGWSSGGPAEYAIALQEKRPVTGSYVAMSVFHKDEHAASLKHAKGQAFFIDHSPEDEICKFELAELARDELKKAGADVEFVTFKGGHGWFDNPYARLKKGFAWLDEHHGKPLSR